MRACRLCGGPMPEIVRDDALYCSTSCKLKAQRRRKKERAAQAAQGSIAAATIEQSISPQSPPNDSPCPTEQRGHTSAPVTPLGEAEQLSFCFRNEDSKKSQGTPTTPAPRTSTTKSAVPDASRYQTPAPAKPRSWIEKLVGKLRGPPRPEKPETEQGMLPRQRSKRRPLDIV